MDNQSFAQVLSVGEQGVVSVADPRVRALGVLSQQMGQPAPAKDDPEREVIARLGDNWSPLILKVLETGEYRHATLKRVVGMLSAEGEISQRMLTLRLKALERDGFVERQVTASVPPRVTYRLTDLGLGLTKELNRLLDWITTNRDQINAAREDFTA